MTAYLLVCHDAGGTVPPMLALAAALTDSGAAVTVLSQPSVEGRAAATGCSFVAFSDLDDYDLGRPLEQQLERTLPALVGASAGDDLLRVAGEIRPAAVVVDANLTGALAAAEKLKVTSVVLLHSMCKTYVDVWFGELWPLLAGGVNETRERFGVPAADGWLGIFARHAAALSVVTSSFDAPVEQKLVNMLHFGFLVPRSATSSIGVPVGDKPLALVSLSTTHQDHDDLLDAIVDAARPYARLLVTTAGYGTVTSDGDDVVVTEYIPHAAVLPKADLVITHGGLGTVAAALSFGVPIVCAPIGRDQHLNTERVEAVGAGIGIARQSSPDEIAAAVHRVLSEPAFAEAAARQAAASEEAGGPAAAAEYLTRISA